MCYLPSISEQIPGIFGDIDELVYVKYQLNISYRLYPTGYSTAYIEYKVTDLYENRIKYPWEINCDECIC